MINVPRERGVIPSVARNLALRCGALELNVDLGGEWKKEQSEIPRYARNDTEARSGYANAVVHRKYSKFLEGASDDKQF